MGHSLNTHNRRREAEGDTGGEGEEGGEGGEEEKEAEEQDEEEEREKERGEVGAGTLLRIFYYLFPSKRSTQIVPRNLGH
jgi:hypothetical protein